VCWAARATTLSTAAPAWTSSSAATGRNTLYRADGTSFESQDGGLATGDGWKDYARGTDKVWYVAASGADDVITVDYVTEPGVLSGHHLVTRLTNNNGNFSFDSQLQLDFGARDENGNLVWDPLDAFYDLTLAGVGDAPADGRIGADIVFSLAVDDVGTASAAAVNPITVTLRAADTTTNVSLDDFVADMNRALQAALDAQGTPLSNRVQASRNGGQVLLTRRDQSGQKPHHRGGADGASHHLGERGDHPVSCT